MQTDTRTVVTEYLWELLSLPKSYVVAVIFWLATVLLVAPAVAALAPHEQRIAELKAIINDPAVVDRFGANHLIEKVERIKPDQYRVSGGQCHLDITIRDAPPSAPMAGGHRFVLELSALVCE